MRSPLLTATLSVVLITLIGYLLVAGRSLILPFVIALIVWYLINALSRGFQLIPLGSWRLPGWVSFPLALATIFGAATFVLDIVTVNLTQLAQDAPTYQQRLEEVFSEISSLVHLNDPIELKDLMPDAVVSRMVTAGAGFLTTIASSASLVFIYVLFLLLEQSTFDRKLERLFTDSEKVKAAFALRAEINRSVMNYFGIKTAVSIATGVLTSLILIMMGLPYAALFGFIAFVLNYIPTIGSLIGVIFPSLLALVFYDTLVPFFVIAVGLGLIQFSIGNLVEPRLMGSSLNLSGLVIMLSLAFWGAIWGVVGMVLCVPLTVVIVIICSKFPASRPVAVLLSANGDIGDIPLATTALAPEPARTAADPEEPPAQPSASPSSAKRMNTG
ncbi:putative PurR-regulated permease PerM [Roseibium hamelinense]|uniref:Putative PurR-regulated permease PerM n=1 Tax=Roseibium hamelinense TaxID=150831 RepID=A0A562T902_9HYPH|nr:AI-2E family transporter [Roseibium hamelinense]MTI45546.1 AI-2E family transporter [Roseibium hamelinense]TWI90077.1 putative PurR-regulated permease PerM [Roseibium hamelinense]